MSDNRFTYMTGFWNNFESEALSGALPVGRNSPQAPPLGLYAEQLSGTSFLAARHENLRSWLYRIRPSVVHGKFEPLERGRLRHAPFDEIAAPPDQLRWNPLPPPDKPMDFIEGIVTMAGNGSETSYRGSAVHIYSCNRSMSDRYFYNSDGDFLILPQSGKIFIDTEFGALSIEPSEICVIPRGIKYTVALEREEPVYGYILENYGLPLRLPNLGPIGANGLANPRDFMTPTAKYEKREQACLLINKFAGNLWQTNLDHCPLDVVAWHGNYYPYKYDLRRFNVINTVSYDHPDPSIFTVLTSPSEIPGVSNIDFVIFPPRWMVAEDTFRPPYYHRNCMSEYMGLIEGIYDAKQEGFIPGGGSLHNCMTAHGPDRETFEKASSMELKPQKLQNTLAFMFESSLIYRPTAFALQTASLQKDYQACWSSLEARFEKP